MTRKAKSCLGTAVLVLLVVLGATAFTGYREWRSRQPFVLEDEDSTFMPGTLRVGGGGMLAALERDASSETGGPPSSKSTLVRLYSIDAGRAQRTLRDPEELPIVALAISPSGEFVGTVVGNDVTQRTTLRFWRVATGDLIWSLELGSLNSDWPWDGGGLLDFAPEGDRLAARNGREVQILDVPTGRVLRKVRFFGDTPSRGLVTFLRRGLLAYRDRKRRGDPEHETLEIYSEEGMKRVLALPIAVNGWGHFSGRRSHFAQLDRGFHVWTLPAGSETAVLKLGDGRIRDFDFSRDDGLFAAAIEDGDAEPGSVTTIRCWSVPDGLEVPVVPRAPRGVCTGLAFAPDRDLLVAAYDGKIHVYPFRR